jgi:hypothetical protein
MSDIFRIDAANIMHETIDGEVVVVNLENGTYYSLDAVGADVWGRLADGASIATLVENIATRYDTESGRITAGIEAFVRRLADEKLIVPVTDAPAGHPASTDAPAPKGAYSDPTLQKYTDMEQLLLVDPIHEVDDTGWPNVR